MHRIKLNLNYSPSDITLIIDGKYLAYRTKYTPTFKLSYESAQTGLYYGFLNTLRKLGKQFNPVNIVLMWDITPLKLNKRKIQFSGYKNRDDISKLDPEELKEREIFADSYSRLMADLILLGFASYGLMGYEADDLIALWCNAHKKGTNIIITRDEDMFQCINENTKIYNIDDKIMKNLSWFEKTYKIPPGQWAKVKAIGGCKSDTIPGVSGVAESTAIKYLIDPKGDNKKYDKIKQARTEIELYLKLTKLPHADLNRYKLKFNYTDLDMSAFVSFCQQNGFKQFLENINDFKVFSKKDNL